MTRFKLSELWHIIAWIICLFAFPRATSVALVVLAVCFAGAWLHRRTQREPGHKPPMF